MQIRQFVSFELTRGSRQVSVSVHPGELVCMTLVVDARLFSYSQFCLLVAPRGVQNLESLNLHRPQLFLRHPTDSQRTSTVSLLCL